MRSLHQFHDESVSAHLPDVEAVPASVRRLDALLNQRVAYAKTGADIDHWMSTKVRIKKALVALPPALVEAAALAVLQELSRAA